MSNRALIVFAHPEPDAFNCAVLAAAVDGLASAGVSVDVADLHAEGFDPRVTAADLALYRGQGPVPEDVVREQARVAAADALIFVAPIYWWSLPAMLKGWVDRVLTQGWAFEASASGITGKLGPRPARYLATAAGDASQYDSHGYRASIATQIEHGIFGFCGITDLQTHLLFDAEAEAADGRRADLEVVKGMGAALAATLQARSGSPA